LQVLFAIGACMVGLALVSHLNYWLVGILGFLIVFGHNALEFVQFEPGDRGYILWTILHDPGDLGRVGPLTVNLSYPLLPWFGVILLGYFSGPLYSQSVSGSKRIGLLIAIGLGCLITLLVLRGFNIYGEAAPWMTQETVTHSVMSFLNYTKYPPSLAYLLLTLGTGMLLLAWLEWFKKPNRLLDAIQVFGSVPMFVYVLHLYVLLAAYWVLFAVFGATQGERFGLNSVAWIWGGAVALIAIHYPMAKAFATYKHQQKVSRPWLSYF